MDGAGAGAGAGAVPAGGAAPVGDPPTSIPPSSPGRAVAVGQSLGRGEVEKKPDTGLLSPFPARKKQESKHNLLYVHINTKTSQAESSFSEEEEEKLQIAFSLEKQDLHLVLETISFILEQAVYHNLKPASLQQQLQSIHLDEDKAEAFASAWAAAGQDTIEKFRQRVLTPQKTYRWGSIESQKKRLHGVYLKNLKKVFVEFSHQELFEFYNKQSPIS
ncbi:COMM domain-containing protein 10 [Aix galericulata]|nr:COMM domain-containing protein 10 [Aix galericulata]